MGIVVAFAICVLGFWAFAAFGDAALRPVVRRIRRRHGDYDSLD